MSDRLLYQSEAEQLVLEQGFVVTEPEVPLPLESRVDFMSIRDQKHSFLEPDLTPVLMKGLKMLWTIRLVWLRGGF